MLDFVTISERENQKSNRVEIYPEFIIRNPSEHLMIRGGDFYAIWVEERGLWSTSEQDVVDIIDSMMDAYAKEQRAKHPDKAYRVLHMRTASTKMIDSWHRYCQKQMRDAFHTLDETLIFSNTPVKKQDYASKRLPYPLQEGDISAWDRILGVLYSPEERHKIEWAIGSIVSGDSKTIQKFIVFYGAAGTGKSTIMNVIEKLFEGYVCAFDAKALGSAGSTFALEAFRSNPLVAIQQDGDLSRIEDNTRINSLVSHETMPVNVKFKSTYESQFKCFLFMGTNRPVKITDAKSGLLRRLIDVTPSGNLLSRKEYDQVTKQVLFELGAIAYHCLRVYKDDPGFYNSYVPVNMMGASNDFYNYVMDTWITLGEEDGITLKAAWAAYKKYCEDANITYPFSMRVFKEELKNYFARYEERAILANGERARSYYSGFIRSKFEPDETPKQEPTGPPEWLDLKVQPSIFDETYADCPAQYANDAGTPMRKWVNVGTKLRDILTGEIHYVKTPIELICIDFDISENGVKNFEKNQAEAAKWPPTYAEVSKSGEAIHLYYIYDGDPTQLSSIYDDRIEVKVFGGNSSLRRKLTRCNNLSIAHISNGLPLKEEKKVVDVNAVQSEKGLRSLIKRNLAKEIHPGTKPSIDFIFKILEDAYNGELSFDVSDMQNAVLGFAAHSTNHADYCVKLVGKMHFKSKDKDIQLVLQADANAPNIFYDIEIFPNYHGINWKVAEDYTPKDFPSWSDYIHELSTNHKPVVRMINPTPTQVEEFLMQHGNQLIDFNGRRYDRHIDYARMMGYSNRQLFDLSQRIVKNDSNAMFREAYNIGKTDVFDFASAGNKKSLKKLEIEMGFHHQELGLAWDKPVDESLWPKVAEYCDNDVLATEAAFNYLSADWLARQILADIADMTVNDTTNTLTTKIIFNGEKNPQVQFQYRNLAEPVRELPEDVLIFLQKAMPGMMAQRHGEAQSLLPYFPGYTFQNGVSMYRGEEVGNGGYVYAEPGMYGNVALLDIASMHPHSVIAECLFGPVFTKRFKEIVDGRVSIKHKAWKDVNDILDGKLTKWIAKVESGELSAKQLANALKTAINSVYGLTSAGFSNPFKDQRNIDNIVAKRGALFMVDLKHEVQKRGFTVAHIKTDSIKIPDATPEIIQFVMEFGKKYGYSFEHEATYDKMCLVNDAVYIAKYDTAERCIEKYGYIPGDIKDHPGEWTATGKQFAVPYVFKKLFSKEDICFDDMCEVFSVTGALYLDFNENLPDVTDAENELKKLQKKPELSEPETKRYSQLIQDITKGHSYSFVGKVGQFTPVKKGCGGGVLLREANGKYSAATGSTGYRWLESELVRAGNLQNSVDRSFYDRLADDAKDTVSKYGDFEWFVSEDCYRSPRIN